MPADDTVQEHAAEYREEYESRGGDRVAYSLFLRAPESRIRSSCARRSARQAQHGEEDKGVAEQNDARKDWFVVLKCRGFNGHVSWKRSLYSVTLLYNTKRLVGFQRGFQRGSPMSWF